MKRMIINNSIQAGVAGVYASQQTSVRKTTGTAAAVSSKDEIVLSSQAQSFSAALQKAKEPFFSEKEGGMGLGLAVGEEILRAHGGELRLENTATGARVSLILPADESAPA